MTNREKTLGRQVSALRLGLNEVAEGLDNLIEEVPDAKAFAEALKFLIETSLKREQAIAKRGTEG